MACCWIFIAWGGACRCDRCRRAAWPLADFVTAIWRSQVRFIGAGAMGVAAIWSLLRTLGRSWAGWRDGEGAQHRLDRRSRRTAIFPSTSSCADHRRNRAGCCPHLAFSRRMPAWAQCPRHRRIAIPIC